MGDVSRIANLYKSINEDSTVEYLAMLSKELAYLLNNLDSLNITSINTNLTTVESEGGTTILSGSQLLMYDANDILRLAMGLNSSNEFIFNLANEIGDVTLSIDSSGDVVVSGKVLASEIEGGTITGAVINNGSGTFYVDEFGDMTATNGTFTGDILGATNIDITEDATIGSTLIMQSDSLDGIYFKDNSGGTVFEEFSITRAAGNSMKLTNSFNDIELETLSGTILLDGGDIKLTTGSGDSISLDYFLTNVILINSGGAFYDDGSSDQEIATRGWAAAAFLEDPGTKFTGTFATGDARTATFANGVCISVA